MTNCFLFGNFYRFGLLSLLTAFVLVGCGGDHLTDSSENDDGDKETPKITEVRGDLVQYVEDMNLPGRGSEGFTPPADSSLDRWRAVVATIMEGNYKKADSLLLAGLPSYRLVRFTDTGYEDRLYYVLQESPSIENGRGSIIFNPNSQRDIVVEVPHPVFDLDTDVEGADFFRQTGAHFLVMAGTHRCANSAASSCDGQSDVCGDGQYHISDMAHYTEAFFQAAHKIIASRFPDLYVFSLHGNGRASCGDLFLSSGVRDEPTAILRTLKNKLASSGLSVAVAGTGTSSCPLLGTTNVQGRFSNGSAAPCRQPATSAVGTFIHVEQSRRVRESPSQYEKLIRAVNELDLN